MLKFAQITNRFYWLMPVILCVWFVPLILSVCSVPISDGDVPFSVGTDSHDSMEATHNLHKAQSATICMKNCLENSDCKILKNSINCGQGDSFTITPEFPQVSPAVLVTTWVFRFPEVSQISASVVFDKFLKIPLPDLRLLACVFLK